MRVTVQLRSWVLIINQLLKASIRELSNFLKFANNLQTSLIYPNTNEFLVIFSGK